MIHGLEDVCSDDALWLVAAIVEYIKETGEFNFADLELSYADQDKGTVYEHMTKILDFSASQVGATGMMGAVQNQIPTEARVPVFDGMPNLVVSKADITESVTQVLDLLKNK